jgi:Holliday junction resolvase RusA-like endonuclease
MSKSISAFINNRPKKKDCPITEGGHKYRFSFVTTPKGQPRMRHYINKNPEAFQRVLKFTPDTADAFKLDVKMAAIEAGLKNKLLNCPIRLSITYQMPRPDSHFDSKGNLKKGFNTTDHIGKPDMDNIIKATKDALSDVWVWVDDCSVSRYGEMLKIYAPPQTAPETTITIETLPW